MAACSMSTGVVLIKAIGKRKLYLISLAGVVVTMIALGKCSFIFFKPIKFILNNILSNWKYSTVIYGFLYLPPHIKSYESTALSTDTGNTSAIPLVLFCILRFFTMGTTLVLLTMLGELFPLKIRNIAGGLTSATINLQVFLAIKLFYNFESWTSLPGAFSIYAAMGAIGYVNKSRNSSQ